MTLRARWNWTLFAVVGLLAGLLAAPAVARAATPTYRVLFDDTSAEEAGNADWIISTSQPDPTAQDASPTSETDWTGALSAWGVALQRTGNYHLDTLPAGNTITYGGSGSLDLSHFDVLVLPEPNILFTSAEKTAIMKFVQAGGGLFMISDHSGSDRNNDGADSVQVLNDLMTNNSVDSTDPFGFSIDSGDISSENPNVVASADDVLDGPFGTVTGTIIRDGTTATLKPADNPDVKGEVYRTGHSATGTTGAAFATSRYGSGRVAYWGDSSPIDDGTGQSGNSLYDGWDDPAGTDAALALNATQWLAGAGGSTGGGGAPLADGGFETAGTWTLGGSAALTTARAHTGTHALALCGANNCADSATQTAAVPAHATLTFWTYTTTQETGTTAYDTLTVKVGGTVVKTLSNAGTTGKWVESSVALTGAAATEAVGFTAAGGTKLPTSFWVDDVSIT